MRVEDHDGRQTVEPRSPKSKPKHRNRQDRQKEHEDADENDYTHQLRTVCVVAAAMGALFDVGTERPLTPLALTRSTHDPQ